MVLPRWLSGNVSALRCRTNGFNPWVGKIPWRRAWQLTPAFLSGESHGQRSLAGLQSMGWQSIDHNLATIQHRETLGRISECTHQKPVGASQIDFGRGRVLCWVFIATHGLSPAAATGGYSLVAGHSFSCSTVCEIFPDRGWTRCPLNWEADSQPLDNQRSPPGWGLGECLELGKKADIGPQSHLCLHVSRRQDVTAPFNSQVVKSSTKMTELWWGLGDTLPWKLALRRAREMRTECREGGHDLPLPSPRGLRSEQTKEKGRKQVGSSPVDTVDNCSPWPIQEGGR